MAITIGKPNPPLRIIAPKGAPTKNKIKQASAKAYLLCNWISVLLMVSAFFLSIDLFPFIFDKVPRTDPMAIFKCCCWSKSV